MGEAFLADAAKQGVTRAVKAVEATTCAELVVAVRRASGGTLAVDLLVGFVCAEISLLLVLFLPEEFPLATIPLDLVLFFALGAFVSSRLPWHGLLLPRAARQERTRAAARAAFFELGVGRTHTRCGILIFISLRERCVALVADVGVDAARVPTGALDAAVAAGDVNAFVAAVEALARPLAAAYPHTDDDVNELPDEANLA